MKANWKKILIVAMCMMMIVGSSLTVNAKPRTGKYVDAQGHIYIYDKNGRPKTGYFTYHGKHYYGHKTSTKKYPKGSVTTNQFRIRSGNKWYAYNLQGIRYEKSYSYRWGRFKRRKSLTVRKNHTVKYVWQITSTRVRRYSTAERRMQRETPSGKWKTIEGMQFIPDGWVDWQR